MDAILDREKNTKKMLEERFSPEELRQAREDR